MGLHSFYIAFAGVTLGMGLDVAVFHMLGRQPSLILVLKTECTFYFVLIWCNFHHEGNIGNER